jgi:hypothetical protein
MISEALSMMESYSITVRVVFDNKDLKD